MNNFDANLIRDKLDKLYFKDGIKLIDKMSDIIIKENSVSFYLEIQKSQKLEAEHLKKQAERILSEIGVDKVSIVLTARKENNINQEKLKIPGIKNMILVSSAKGGVGKSTISAALGISLAREGFKVGILDADIYGPSMPIIFCKHSKPLLSQGKFVPFKIEKNLIMMSMGCLVSQNQAMVWRGPMATKALHQLFTNVNWGDLDFLIVDMPPGTGDVHLSILDKYKIHDVLLITLPDLLSMSDLYKTIDMYKKFQTPIAGIVENMSYIKTNDRKTIIFGEGGGEKLAEEYNLILRAKVPLYPFDDKLNAIARDQEMKNIIEFFAKKSKLVFDKK